MASTAKPFKRTRCFIPVSGYYEWQDTPSGTRGGGVGIHTPDSAHDKAYVSVSFKNDTLALAERAKGEDSIAPLAKLP